MSLGSRLGLRIAIDGPDLFLGTLALAVSGGYLFEASRIPESLLADAVGARGVPTAVGWATAALGLIVCVRGVVTRAPAIARHSPDGGNASVAARSHARALGLLALLIAYVAALPWVGYVVATALLTGAVARYAGAAFGRNLVLVAIAGGLALWLVFDPLLGIALPTGSWWQAR